MSYSDHKKVFKQLRAKPVKLKKFMKHNAPKERKNGRSTKKCRRCGRIRGHIKKYGLDLCRQCFREIATKLGFKKYN
jgi:small subunit ribosomal protein S14